ALAVTAVPAALAQNQPQSPAKNKAPFTLAEKGQTFQKLSDAVAAIGTKSGTIVIAPGTYRQCAVQSEGQITYRSTVPGQAILEGSICDGKAALVLRIMLAVVDVIDIQSMRVPVGNGADIRLERGDLTDTKSVFRNSEQVLITANNPNNNIVIERSTFRRLGR